MCQAMDVLSVWLASNRLHLNSFKTQLIWVSGGRRFAGVDRCWMLRSSHMLTCLIQSGTWGLFLAMSSVFLYTESSSPVPAFISFASCGSFPALCLVMLQPPYPHPCFCNQ